MPIFPDPHSSFFPQNVPSFLTPADLCGEKLAMFLGVANIPRPGFLVELIG